MAIGKEVKEGIGPVTQGVTNDGPAVPGNLLEKTKLYLEGDGGSYGYHDGSFEYLFVLKGILTEEQAEFFFEMDTEHLNLILQPIFEAFLKIPDSIKDVLRNEDITFFVRGALTSFFESVAYSRLFEVVPKDSFSYKLLEELGNLHQVWYSLLRSLVKEFIPDFLDLL